jgi:hypothetical protein
MNARQLKALRKPIRRLSRVMKGRVKKNRTNYEVDRLEVLTTEYFRLKELLDTRSRAADVATILQATGARWSKDYRVGDSSYSIIPKILGGKKGDSIMVHIPSEVRGAWIDSGMLPTYVATHDFIPSEARLWHSGMPHALCDKTLGAMEESWIIPEVLTRDMMEDMAKGWASKADYADNCEADDLALEEGDEALEMTFLSEMLRNRLAGCERNLVKALATFAFGEDYLRSKSLGMDYREPFFSKKLETGHIVEIGIKSKFWVNIDLLPADTILAMSEAHYPVLRPTVKWQISKSTMKQII